MRRHTCRPTSRSVASRGLMIAILPDPEGSKAVAESCQNDELRMRTECLVSGVLPTSARGGLETSRLENDGADCLAPFKRCMRCCSVRHGKDRRGRRYDACADCIKDRLGAPAVFLEISGVRRQA